MSLSISLAEFEQKGGSVTLDLPSNNSTEIKCKRLLKYMAREGFISLFADRIIIRLPFKTEGINIKPVNRIVKVEGKPITKELPDKLKEINVPLAFERSTCLPVTLLHLECPKNLDDTRIFGDIDRWVERKLHEEIEPVISAMVPGWAQRSIRYRLLTVLREMLHNVAEHAYDKPDNKSGFAAVYVRYREGALGEAPENWMRLEKFIKREQDEKQVPLMTSPSEHESFPRMRTGFFELFVLDSGIGLCNSFNDPYDQKNGRSLNKYMEDIFDNSRRRKEKLSTKNGGLFLIRNTKHY